MGLNPVTLVGSVLGSTYAGDSSVGVHPLFGSNDILCQYSLSTSLAQISFSDNQHIHGTSYRYSLSMDQDKGDMLGSSQPAAPLFYVQVRSLIHPWFFFLPSSPHPIHQEALLALTSKSCLDPITFPTSLSNLCYYTSLRDPVAPGPLQSQHKKGAPLKLFKTGMWLNGICKDLCSISSTAKKEKDSLLCSILQHYPISNSICTSLCFAFKAVESCYSEPATLTFLPFLIPKP